MTTLLIRTVIIYLLVFCVVRLTGKRQISDMQPFDLVITLLIADLASAPISDSSIPLMNGMIPIMTLFVLHRLVAFFALKSLRLRSLLCGHPIVVIQKGVVVEEALRAANYTINDLIEQLRLKDVFSLSDAEYAILETNGSLSVLKTNTAEEQQDCPSPLLLCDGKPISSALKECGLDEKWLKNKLAVLGFKSFRNCLFACLEGDKLHVQSKSRYSKYAKTLYLDLGEKSK